RRKRPLIAAGHFDEQQDSSPKTAPLPSIELPTVQTVSDSPAVPVANNAGQVPASTVTYLVSGRPASPFQAAIFEEIVHGSGDILVEAAAGSGRTSTLCEAIAL